MNFTPQQMRGGGRYKSHTRIGNWFEEIAVEDSKQADFQRKVSDGNLLLRNHQSKKNQCMAKVPQSFSADGNVKYGDYITLVHDSTSVQLACDPFDDIFPPWNKFQVSGVASGPPVARTTFRITRPPSAFKSPLGPEDDVLKYGQPFSLICNESLRYTEGSLIRDPDLYLSSTLKNERNATKGSNRQCAYLATAHTADAVWYCMRPSKGRDPSSERFIAVGHPVAAEFSFVLTHHSSNTFLTADATVKEYTDFGVEVEICAEKSASVGKLGIVVSERAGIATPQTLTKPDIPTNLWHFEYSDSPDSAEDWRVIPDVANADTLLRDMKRQILARGIFGMVEFRRKIMDNLRGATDSTREVSSIVHREDARIAFMSAGCEYKDLHFDLVFDFFDKRKSGHVDIFVMLKHLCQLVDDESSCDFSSRDDVVSRKYKDLCNGKKGVTVDDLTSRFHPEELPFVKSEQYSAAEALDGFSTAFPQMRKAYEAPVVKLTQFSTFFVDIGASIPDDAYFNDIVNSSFY